MTTTTQPKERPILFTGPLVREILAGRKTQTRRLLKPQPRIGIPDRFIGWTAWNEAWSTHDARELDPHVVDEWTCPYGYPGTRLWVRETWSEIEWTTVIGQPGPPRKEVVYRAGPHPFGKDVPHGWTPGQDKWRPSIFMPREACRLELEVTAVRIERLQSISGEDAIAEGFGDEINPCYAFAAKWDEINGNGSWDANPFVWVVTFDRVDPANAG